MASGGCRLRPPPGRANRSTEAPAGVGPGCTEPSLSPVASPTNGRDRSAQSQHIVRPPDACPIFRHARQLWRHQGRRSRTQVAPLPPARARRVGTRGRGLLAGSCCRCSPAPCIAPHCLLDTVPQADTVSTDRRAMPGHGRAGTGPSKCLSPGEEQMTADMARAGDTRLHFVATFLF